MKTPEEPPLSYRSGREFILAEPEQLTPQEEVQLPTTNSNIPQMRQELSGLSGSFGDTMRNPDELYVVSNDQSLYEVVSCLTGDSPSDPEGLGLIVGSGTFSLLPEAKVAVPLVIDKNPYVLDASRVVYDLIVESEAPLEVFDKLDCAKIRERYPILPLYKQARGCEILDRIEQEALSFTGPSERYHWIYPERFKAVQETLKNNPPIWLEANLTQPEFLGALADIATKYEVSIGYANFTNVHEYIPKSMRSILGQLPLKKDVRFVFSKLEHELSRDILRGRAILRAQYRRGAEKYLETIGDDWLYGLS